MSCNEDGSFYNFRMRFVAPRWAMDDVQLEVLAPSSGGPKEMVEVVRRWKEESDEVSNFGVVHCRVWCSSARSKSSVEDEWEESGTPLATYAMSCVVDVPVEAMARASQLLEWHRVRRIDIEAPTLGSVQAWVLALHSVEAISPGDATPRNAFWLAAAGAALRASGIEAAAARVAATTLTTRSLVRAVAYAIDRNNNEMLRACYARLKLSGAGRGKPIEYCSGKFVVGAEAFDASVFAPLVAAEHQLKEPLFVAQDEITTPGVIVSASAADEELATTLTGVDEDDEDEVRHNKSVSQSVFSPKLRRCYLVRSRCAAPNGDDVFALYDDSSLSLLCAARGRKGASRFVLALATFEEDAGHFDRHHPNFLGELTSSLGGSRFVLRDWGVDDLPSTCLPKLRRRVWAAVTYKANVLGRVPNTMRVALVQDSSSRQQQHKALRFRTRKAKWNERLNMWTLEFQERVKRASKKNFQLLPEGGGGEVVLLFGKVSKNRFSLDFAPPFAPATALAVALTTFAHKLVAA